MKIMGFLPIRNVRAVALVTGILLTVLAQAKDKYKVLYSFTGNNDGGAPIGHLVSDKAGNLYGTAVIGGTGCSACGVVFRLTPTQNGWKESVLYNFRNSGDNG